MSTYDKEYDPRDFGPEPPHIANPPKRTWVGLTDDELLHIGVATGLERVAAQMIANKLKQKNGYAEEKNT